MGTLPRYLSDSDRLAIEAELARAASALATGNDGKARVCARRACGVALRAWYALNERPGLPADAQSLLRHAASDDGLPVSTREAAGRLPASVAGAAGDLTTDPIADAVALIAALAPAPAPGRTGGDAPQERP